MLLPADPTVAFPSPETLEVRIGSKLVFAAKVRRGDHRVEVTREAAEPVHLGYSHGPEDAQFVPEGTARATWSIRVQGGLAGKIAASRSAFACSTETDAPLASLFGGAVSRSANAVYDRDGDWLLTGGPGVRFAALSAGKFAVLADGDAVLHLKTDYVRNHLGYFLWDRRKPLWPQPIAGWCSWMAHLQGVTETDVLEAGRFFARNLLPYGYDVVQIDDGFQRAPQNGNLVATEPFHQYWTVPNDKFPSGLGKLATELSGLGLTPGIWIGDYLPLGLKNAQAYVQGPDGQPFKGPWVGYAMNALDPAARKEAYLDSVRVLRDAGWRYFKIDTLRHVLYDSYRKVPGYWESRGQSMEEAFRKLLSETKRTAGRDNYVLACWGTMPELAGLVDGARIGEDVGPDVASMRRSAGFIAQFHHLNNVVWLNDPDYMCLRVPLPQAKTWATLAALAGGHLMVSDPVASYDAARVDILRRVGPPLVTKPGNAVQVGPDPEWMLLHAEKFGEEWTVAARLSWDGRPQAQVPLERLGLDPDARYLAFDFWQSRFLGEVRGQAAFDALGVGECQVVSFRPALDRPQVLGTDRHIGQGAAELEGVRWAANRLSGRMLRGPGRRWSLFVHVPEGWKVDGCEGGQPTMEGRVATIAFSASDSPVDWSVSFKPG